MNINRIVHPGFWFGKSDIKEAVELAKAGVGGFCIYFGTRKEVKELTDTLQANAPHKLLISADYEYGLGRWLPDAPLLPSNISIGSANKEELSYKKGFLTACEAKTLGVDWVLAPDIDLADTPQNPIVNTRSFGADPKRVGLMARAFMLGLEDGGCLNVLKHFPGHGSTIVDSHMKLPMVNKTLAQLEDAELVPYRRLITKADSIMIAHLQIDALDKENPTSFSYKVITDFLRKQLHYKGLIVTDALVMKATGGLNPIDAFKAGADVLLCPDNPFEVLAELKAEIAKDKVLVERAVSAISVQEMMLAKLNTFNPLHCKDPFDTDSFCLTVAEAAVACTGKNIVLKKNSEIYYLEADIYPANDFKADDFVAELKANGIKVKPYKQGDKPELLVVSTMSNYAAFSGHINFTAEQKELVHSAVKAAQNSVLISYGSPFVNSGIEGLSQFLMAGTQTGHFQKVCAEILLGLREPRGTMPV